jgi:uncharacterized membrane protein
MSDQGEGSTESKSDPDTPEVGPQLSYPDSLPPSLDSALRTAGVDPQDPDVFRAVELSLRLFRGNLPIPPPVILEEYRQVSPALLDKILDWTEKQAEHRRSLELAQVTGSERRLNRGQFIAASVALGGLVLAAGVAVFGNPWAASVIAIVSVGGPTAAVALARAQKPSAPSAEPPVPGRD